MAEPFFASRTFFQTSFLIPNTVSQNQLQSAINAAVAKRFRVFCALLDEEHKIAYLSDEKKSVELETVTGNAVKDIHNAIIRMCEEDHKNAFRLFWGENEEGNHYLVVHAHHGVADGFMITSFAREVFHRVHGTECPDRFVFELANALSDANRLLFPDSWIVDGKEGVEEGLKRCEKYIQEATTYPIAVCSESRDFVNAERVINSGVCKRAISLAKSMGTLNNCGGCIHGMLVYCSYRAILNSEDLPHSGSMTMNTIVNMRRYWNQTGVGWRCE